MSRDDANDNYDAQQAEAELSALERRLWRNMLVALAAVTAGSLLVVSWRVTAGLALGGALAFFNYHWLRTSLAAVMGRAAQPDAPRDTRARRYFLRYFIIALVVAGAYRLDLVSLPATIIGLCAFVAALLFEGAAQLYSAIVKEET
jgi:hypothetical protein